MGCSALIMMTVSTASGPDTVKDSIETASAVAAAAPTVVAHYVPILAVVGALILVVAWLPLVLRRAPLSLPILSILIGMVAFQFTPLAAYAPHTGKSPWLIEKATELIVIIALMGAGLKMSRPLGWKSWNITWRLLGITMPLTMILLALAGHYFLGLGLASAILIGACLAPTDPVLASDVQIESLDQKDQRDEVRFSLTSEAGLNDALAFPFVHLAIALAGLGALGWDHPDIGTVLAEWAWDKIVVKLTVGLIAGYALGRAMGWIIYRLPKGTSLSRTGDGFVALGATLFIYAVTELLHGYGFLAVFVAGMALRATEMEHEYNEKLHGFADETERLLMMAMLVMFGGMLVNGNILLSIEWQEIAFLAFALLIARPLAGMIGLIGSNVPLYERFIISFFGIRGLGSVYYLAYALNHGTFGMPTILWAVLGLVVLGSILLHGITVTPAMNRLEKLSAAK